MKLIFEKHPCGRKFYTVKEDGVDTKKTTYEILGMISTYKSDPFFKVDEDYSGIIHFNEFEQIYKFMKEKLK